jgi:hypothetical protein
MNHSKIQTPVESKLLRFNPSAYLLAAQLLMLILYAIFDGLHSQRAIISAFSVVVLVMVVWVAIHSPAINWLVWSIAVPSFVLSLLSAIFANTNLLVWSSLLDAFLYFYAAASLIVYMLGDDKVTTDELFAIGATFTLLAWGFAYLYLVCQTLLPGSFASPYITDRPFTFIEYLFLSFSNLSSTGLSDLVPVTAWARVLVMLAQFFGVGYIAIVVSRLIGLTISKKRSR